MYFRVNSGKTGKAYGALINLLATIKGLPSGYNRDLQESKIPLKESFEAAEESLEVLTKVLKTLKINKTNLQNMVERSYATALDLAETLVMACGLSFREAHIIVGKLVLKSIKENSPLTNVTSDMLKILSKEFLGKVIAIDDTTLSNALNPQLALKGKRSTGSPSPIEVKKSIQLISKEIANSEKFLNKRETRLAKSKDKLKLLVMKYTL